jgi:hypothetical protein
LVARRTALASDHWKKARPHTPNFCSTLCPEPVTFSLLT